MNTKNVIATFTVLCVAAIAPLLNGAIVHGATINIFLSIFTLPLLKYCDTTAIKNSISSSIVISAIVFLDTLYRLIFPLFNAKAVADSIASGDEWFYIYKYNSVIFVDSNLVSILIFLNIFVLHSMIKNRPSKLLYFLIFINISSLILCFSRAAYLGVLVYLFLILFLIKKNYAITIFIAGIVSFYGISTFFLDPSLITKFEIYDRSFSLVYEMNFFEYFKGLGFGYYLHTYDRAVHSIIAQTAIEGGIIISSVFVFCIVKMGCFKSKMSFIRFVSIYTISLSASIYILFPAWLITEVLCKNNESKC